MLSSRGEIKIHEILAAAGLIFKEDESKGVKWISLEEATNNEILDFIRPVNKKIIEKLKTTF